MLQGALYSEFSHFPGEHVDTAVRGLLSQGRLELDDQHRLRLGKKYVVLSSDNFHHRIDALNHDLQAVYRSVIERLVTDNSRTAMIKTVSFSAKQDDLTNFMKHLEGRIRQEVAELEETAEFEGEQSRFSLGVCIAPVEESQ